MRRITPLISLVIVLAACSGTTTDTTAAPTTTAAAADEVTTTTAATTTTTTAAETTTTAPTTTEATGALAFETTPNTPPDAFDSFAAEMTMTMGLGEQEDGSGSVEIEVGAEGIWTDDAFSCVVSSGMGGISFSETLVATPDQLYIDQGNGFESTSLFGSSAQELMGSCPTSPLFWQSFVADDVGTISGEEELIDGRPAIKADLAELMDGLGGLGLLGGFEGAVIYEMTMWIDTETQAVIAMIADMEMSDDLLGEAGTTEVGPIRIKMEFTISQVNDQSLVVEVPDV